MSTQNNWNDPTKSWLNILTNLLNFLVVLNLSASLVLFSIVGHIASSIFKCIQKKKMPSDANTFLLRKALLHYISACETVDAINYCFGWICLTILLFCSIGLINSSFFLFGLNISIYLIIFPIFYSIHLIIMCYTGDNIAYQVKLYYFYVSA